MKTELRLMRFGILQLLLVTMLSACTSKGLIPSNTAKTGKTIPPIQQQLQTDINATQQNNTADVPDSVMTALTPRIEPRVSKRNPARFDIAVNEVAVKDFFAGLVEGTKYNIVVHPDVKGIISLQLKDVTVPDVMEIVREVYGYQFERKGRLYKVLPSGLRTEVFQINYLDIQRSGDSETRVSSGQITAASGNSASSSSGSSSSSSSGGTISNSVGTRIVTTNQSHFWSKLEGTLKLIIGDAEGRSVVTTPSVGIVVVKASAAELASVKDYLTKAELIMRRQVILEAKILEVELSKGYQQGIDWSFKDSTTSLAGDGLPKKFVDISQNSVTLASPEFGGVFASTLRVGSFDGLIELLGTQGNVQVLSSPRISTINNQKAVIKVGNDEYFVTDINLDTNNDSNSTSTDVQITPFFSGIALDVIPQISKNGDITLHVHPSISDVQDQQKRISIGSDELNLPLAFSTIRETDSVIHARDRQVVVIGGLIQDKTVDDTSAVPLLSEIPWLGEAFIQRRQNHVKSELVILIKPIITDAKAIKGDMEGSLDRFQKLGRELGQSPYAH